MAGTGGKMESVAAARPEGAAQPFRDRLVRVLAVGEVGVLAALALIIAFFYVLEPAFLSDRNIRAILTVVSFVGIIAIGQTILLVNGEFDLSVGSVAGLSAVSSAKLMTALALPVPLAILGGMLVGAGVGLVNGFVVVRLRIPAFIQTLGMLFIGQGLIQVVTNGYPVYPLPPIVGDIGFAAPALRPRLELRLLHRRRARRGLRAPPHRARPQHVRHRRQSRGGASRRHQYRPLQDRRLRLHRRPLRDRRHVRHGRSGERHDLDRQWLGARRDRRRGGRRRQPLRRRRHDGRRA